ncbi:MAG: TPR Domain containing protein [Candidatus Peregrinibacteria bacterium GW2011_GWE2_39_6]|nr:MAG: TPR Domain containing protein [Candidatus Peregrinibacteria bacterium GW2011_GWF2_39_17]KKR26383.1 MAG: TPR Domain containing protein [Candidatus Peregrinibacteria bacterium GW2011_GWE2_39_6]HCW32531.1 hypothetical protein [Candidatus Peregrinibacteria bacterium]
MLYWILFIISLIILFWIFWKRWKLTKRSLVFEQELEKKAKPDFEEISSKESISHPPAFEEIRLKRKEEQRARDEKTRRIQESKKAFKQAELYFSKKDYAVAEKYLLQVLSFDNDHLDANFKLGLLYLQQENLPRAEFFFQKLTDLKPHPLYYSNLALTLYQQNRLLEASRLYEKAIELDNKEASRFVNLAHIYKELGEKEKALLAFEEASRLDSRNLDYLWTLADYYQHFSKWTNLKDVFRKIIELDPYNEKAKNQLAYLEEQTK